MKKYYEVLSQSALFDGLEQRDMKKMIECLSGRVIHVLKGDYVFLEGDPATFVGVLLSGAVQIVRDDIYGNRSVMTVLKPGDLFAEVFSCAECDSMPVSALALSDSEVLLLDCRCVFSVCNESCDFHNLLMKNLMREMARKTLELSQKIHYMSQKTTKDKLIAYLSDEAKKHGSREFVIPHDRQSLADYLGVERTAMSAELSKLKNAGEIDTRGSWFYVK